jgi:hypothetical protein
MITPSLLTYGMLLLTIYYIFSMIGLELFGTAIKSQDFRPGQSYNCFNSKLNESEFVKYI